jgi:hypothetical protein
MIQILIRFLVGGAVVSVFALIGDVLKPKSFAGLFGAAPSVALATLGLTVATKGAPYAAIVARSIPNHCCFPKQYAIKMFYYFLEYQSRKTEHSGFNPHLLPR